MVGNTPHVRTRDKGTKRASIYIKLEGCNPSGSIKDRACLRMIQSKLDNGSLRSGMTILDASSGNMGCAIAFFGRLLGYRTEVVVSSKLTDEKAKFLLHYGAVIHKVGDFTIEGNTFCRTLVQRDTAGLYCFLDQLHNWENPRAYRESLGPEILADFKNLTMIVGSVGSGGSLLGVGQYIKEKRPDVRIIAVQSARGTRIPGTGSFDEGDYVTPFVRTGIDGHVFDNIVRIHERDAIRRTLQLRDQGLFCGLQTGATFHAANEEADRLGVRGEIVAISGDAGWKNLARLLQSSAQA